MIIVIISSVQFSSVTQSCLTLCDPVNCSMPGLPVYHQLPESTQTHVHWVSDTIQPSYPLSSPSPPALNLSSIRVFSSKSVLWYIYTMEYYSAIKNNAFESVLMRWMKLEPIIQSEVSQKEKHQYSVSSVQFSSVTQLCPTLCDPIDGSPPGSPIPGILQARTLEWVAISFSNAWKWKVKVKSLSRVRLFATPWTAAHQAPLSMGFSRQEYWSGVPLLSP